MYDDFIFEKQVSIANINLNYYRYLQASINEEGLAKFVMQNILKGLTLYDIDDKLSKQILQKIIQIRIKNNKNIKSGYIGSDTELFYVGFLDAVLHHKILSKNNSLEYASMGIDILSLSETLMQLSEVKSSYQNKKGNNQIKIMEAINSVLCKESKVLDQSNDLLMSIVHDKGLSEKDKEVVRNFIKGYITSDIDFEEHIIQELKKDKLQINLCIITKDNIFIESLISQLENKYINKYCKGKSSCKLYSACQSSRIHLLFEPDAIPLKINIYHILLDMQFTNLGYYKQLLKEVEQYAN